MVAYGVWLMIVAWPMALSTAFDDACDVRYGRRQR
jgi:hypothetical protein